jgi:hypothetical protein
MASTNTIIDVNARYWPGPNAAGMGKPTIPDPTLSISSAGTLAGEDKYGTHQTLFMGRNSPGATRNSVGPNVAGAPKSPVTD